MQIRVLKALRDILTAEVWIIETYEPLHGAEAPRPVKRFRQKGLLVTVYRLPQETETCNHPLYVKMLEYQEAQLTLLKFALENQHKHDTSFPEAHSVYQNHF